MPPPKVEQVNSTTNQEVTIDHQHKATGEAAINIGEYGATEKNNVEIQLAGNIKSWPVAYVKNTKPKLLAQFGLEKETEEFIQKRLEGNATITGTGTLGGVAVKLEVELTKAELEAHKGFFVTPEFETKNATLANKILYEAVPITWKWKVTEAGTNFEQTLGTTTVNFYLTNAATIASNDLPHTPRRGHAGDRKRSTATN